MKQVVIVRPDLLQIVIVMAVTREGIPVRLWTFPGTASDQVLIRKVKDDLAAGTQPGHLVPWTGGSPPRSTAATSSVAAVTTSSARSFAAARSRRPLRCLARRAITRSATTCGSMRSVSNGVMRDRFVICHNPERAVRDQVVRGQILVWLAKRIDSSDALSTTKRQQLYGSLRTKAAFHRFLRLTPGNKLRVDRAAVAREARLDGKFLLRTSDQTLTATDIALGYKLYEVERGWRDTKSTIDVRLVYHRKSDRIAAHVQLCWLALLILRRAEVESAAHGRTSAATLVCRSPRALWERGVPHRPATTIRITVPSRRAAPGGLALIQAVSRPDARGKDRTCPSLEALLARRREVGNRPVGASECW
jgi:hypothetical protein